MKSNKSIKNYLPFITYLISVLLIINVFFAPSVFAQSTTSKNKTATTAAELEKVQKIIDLVASYSATRGDLEKRGVLGKIKDASATKILIEDYIGNQRTIDIDELTKFISNGDSKSFGISDIKPGDTFVFIGKYNRETERLLARYVSKSFNIPTQFEGVVLSKDTKAGTLFVSDGNGNKKTIDVSPSTKTSTYTRDAGMVKSGFSKIENGKRIIATGFDDLKEKDMINASRIIYFSELSLSEKMKKELEDANQESTAPNAEKDSVTLPKSGLEIR